MEHTLEENKSNYIYVDWYSYLYLFMIVIYAGGANFYTQGLIGGSSIIGFLIPLVMTIILYFKHKVKFTNRTLLIVLLTLTFWFVAQYIHKDGEINITLTLFHYYQLILCYIIIQIFRERIFYIYEDILYKLTIISLILWFISIVAPQFMANAFRAVGNGTTISEGNIILYTMMLLKKVHGIIRNSGFAWEPGRFACFICLAIYCNFLINGYSIKNNKRLYVFVFALISTQSTTGAFSFLALLFIFFLNQNNYHKFIWIIPLILFTIFLINLEFVGEKAQKQILSQTEMNNNKYKTEGRALDRIESAVIEWDNLKHDPILGYGEWRHSKFTKTFKLGFFVDNGTMTLWAKYGLILGLLYYICIFISSKRIGNYFGDKFSITYLLLFILIGMGYDFNQIVLIMVFSFWGIFIPQETLQNKSLAE